MAPFRISATDDKKDPFLKKINRGKCVRMGGCSAKQALKTAAPKNGASAPAAAGFAENKLRIVVSAIHFYAPKYPAMPAK